MNISEIRKQLSLSMITLLVDTEHDESSKYYILQSKLFVSYTKYTDNQLLTLYEIVSRLKNNFSEIEIVIDDEDQDFAELLYYTVFEDCDESERQ